MSFKVDKNRSLEIILILQGRGCRLSKTYTYCRKTASCFKPSPALSTHNSFSVFSSRQFILHKKAKPPLEPKFHQGSSPWFRRWEQAWSNTGVMIALYCKAERNRLHQSLTGETSVMKTSSCLELRRVNVQIREWAVREASTEWPKHLIKMGRSTYDSKWENTVMPGCRKEWRVDNRLMHRCSPVSGRMPESRCVKNPFPGALTVLLQSKLQRSVVKAPWAVNLSHLWTSSLLH